MDAERYGLVFTWLLIIALSLAGPVGAAMMPSDFLMPGAIVPVPGDGVFAIEPEMFPFAAAGGIAGQFGMTIPDRTGADPFSVIDTKFPPADASALKGRILETLHAFSYDETTGSWYARNTANRITFTYTPMNGTAAFSGPGTGTAFGMTLAGLCRDDTCTPAGRGVATASGRELNITRPAYTEWYRNTDTGIEQGMTITSRPPGTGPLQVRFGLAGNATRSGTDVTALTFTGASGEPLFTYTGLFAVSADGTALPVSLATDGTSLSWVVDDTRAVYPITIDPVVSASAADARFTGGATNDYFGYFVALSSDGSTALVGAYNNDTPESNTGAAYIFEKGGGWSSKTASAANAQLTGGLSGESFGWSVALSSDGSTALVGAISNETAGSDSGAAYIFVKPGGGWVSRSASAADAWFTGGAMNDYFGYSVALSPDGSTALVGAYYNDTADSDAGAAYIFEKGGGWSSKSASAANAQFTGGLSDDNLGYSVALSGDTALIGAPYNRTAGSGAGAAYIFEKGGGWSSKSASAADSTFTGGAANDEFGYSVALSSDGSAALVGATRNDTAASDAGAAYLFLTAAAPTITGISPTGGTTAGGTSVTITGTAFTGATAVKFGATNAASYTVNSATQITAVSPAGSAGTVDITVTTSAGTSATGAADRFTYSTPTPTPTPTPAPADNGGSNNAPGSSGSPTFSTAANIVAGQPATFSFDQNPTVISPVALNEVKIVFNQNQGNVELMGGTVSYGGSIPGQNVVGFITIELVGLNPNLVNGATISFSVNGQYLRDHHIDPAQVTLMRNHDGRWSPLTGSLVSQNGDAYQYEVQTPGFSQFAVVVSPAGIDANTTMVSTLSNGTTPGDQVVTTAPAPLPATRPVAESTVTSVPVTTATTAVPAAPVTDPGIPVIVLEGIVALGAVIGGVFLFRRWWIRRQNTALFREYD